MSSFNISTKWTDLQLSPGPVLKGSWDLVTRVIIRVTILVTPIKVLITLLTKSHDPPSIAVAHPTHCCMSIKKGGRAASTSYERQQESPTSYSALQCSFQPSAMNLKQRSVHREVPPADPPSTHPHPATQPVEH